MNKYYSDFKIFHFSSKLKELLSGVVSAPIHIRLKPTNRCNHRCFYCCYRNKNLHLSQLMKQDNEIPLEKMREITSDLAVMGIKAVTFSGGGEPLCYPHILETFQDLISAGIKISVLTNGSLLKGEVAKFLSKKASWLRISMDAADPQLYSKSRGVSFGEFECVCRNIYNFARNSDSSCKLGVNFVVTRGNARDIYKFLRLMKGLKVNNVKISEAVVSSEREENRRHYRDLFDIFKKEVAKGRHYLEDDKFTIIDKFNYFERKENNFVKKYEQCPSIQCLTIIAADMNVYTCHDKAYSRTGKIGSIRNKSFRELWFSKQTKEKLIKLNPSKVCRHHCAQHKKNIMLFEYLKVNKEHLEFI